MALWIIVGVVVVVFLLRSGAPPKSAHTPTKAPEPPGTGAGPCDALTTSPSAQPQLPRPLPPPKEVSPRRLATKEPLSPEDQKVMDQMMELVRQANDPERIRQSSLEAIDDLTALGNRDLVTDPLTDEECRLVLAYAGFDGEVSSSDEQASLDKRTTRLSRNILERWVETSGQVVRDGRMLAVLRDSMTPSQIAEYKAAGEGARREALREMQAAARKLARPRARSRATRGS